MNKKITCLIVSLMTIFTTSAQLSVSVNELPGGVVQNSQLWNLALIYSGSSPLNVKVGISLFEVNGNQPVMTAYSRPITLSQGVKQLRYAEVAPIDYTYFSGSLNFNNRPEGFLPIGNYRVCYSVSAAKGEVLFEDCFNVDVQPLSPPELNLPSDSETVKTQYPQFTWLPPAPITMFNDLNYDLIVTEVQPGQAAQDAIQQNLPVYNVRRLTMPLYNSPASNKALDTGKVYAWRIIAKTGESVAAQSDVWTFTINNKREPEPPAASRGTYLDVRQNSQYASTAIVKDDLLNVKYYSYDQEHTAAIRFIDASGSVIRQVKRKINYGDNFLAFRLGSDFSPEKIYLIEISDLQNRQYRGSFRLSK